MATDSSDKVRLTADLPFAEANALKELAAQQGVTMTEALRRAIATEGLLQDRRKSGSKVLLEKDGNLSELVFTR
jgi:Ribbon-helix-helix protein, copG family